MLNPNIMGLTREDALNQIRLLEEYVKTIPPAKTKEELMEEAFIGLMNQGLTLKLGDGEMTYYKDDKWVVHHKFESKQSWFAYGMFWSFFVKSFSCYHMEIKDFLDRMLVKHLIREGFTTCTKNQFNIEIEDKHLKMISTLKI